MYIYDDIEFYVPTRSFMEHNMMKGGNSYLYEFSYVFTGNSYAAGPNMPPLTVDETPHHSQELIYIIGQHIANLTPKDYQIQFLFSQMFVDFMNHGTPATGKRNWTEFDPKLGNYFDIDFPDPTLESPGMMDGYHQTSYMFWESVVPQYVPYSNCIPIFIVDLFFLELKVRSLFQFLKLK